MTFETLLGWVAMQDGRLRAQFQDVQDEQKRTFGRLLKVGEEFGELCSEVLGYYSLQRKDKLEKYSTEKLEGEFADVLITTLLLANHLGIDVEKSLEQKIEKIDARYEQ